MIKSCATCYWYDLYGCRASFSLQSWKDNIVRELPGLCQMWSTHYSEINIYYRYKKELKYD